jgi:hypothetical protein
MCVIHDAGHAGDRAETAGQNWSVAYPERGWDRSVNGSATGEINTLGNGLFPIDVANHAFMASDGTERPVMLSTTRWPP